LHSAARLAILLPGAVAAVPALSQNTATTISPLKVQADHNGVNIATGQARVDVPALSVPAAPRLSFDLLQNAMPHLVARISGAAGEYTNRPSQFIMEELHPNRSVASTTMFAGT
jgi:hypothetical protein